MKYYDVLKEESFLLEGSVNLNKNYNRFDDKTLNKLNNVNKSLSKLAMCSSGIILKFETNSKNINIKATISNKQNLPNLTSISESGFDIYVYNNKSNKYIYYSSTKYPYSNNEFNLKIFENKQKEFKKFLIYFPLYSKVEKVFIGLDNNAKLLKSKPYDKRILIYGTSITQGASASRSGLSYSNIISRYLNVEIFNYGFSGQAFLEKAIAEEISKIKNNKLLLIDAEPNAGVDDRFINNLPTFIETYRKNNPKIPIVIASRITYSFDFFNKTINNKRNENNKWLKKYIINSNDKNLYYIDGSKIFNKYIDEMTIDGIHPNDLGMVEIAKYYMNVIEKLI